MGEIDRPTTGVKWPLTVREYGVILNPDEPEHVLLVGTDLEEATSIAGDTGVVWRAVGQWQSLDTMG